MERLCRVVLVNANLETWVGIAYDRNEAAIAALAAHNADRMAHAWKHGDITALPMLRTFVTYEDVAQYWEDVESGGIKVEYWDEVGPNTDPRL